MEVGIVGIAWESSDWQDPVTATRLDLLSGDDRRDFVVGSRIVMMTVRVSYLGDEQSGEGRTVTIELRRPQSDCHHGGEISLRRQKGVEQCNVHEDRRQNRQRKRHKSICKQQEPRDELEAEHGRKVVRNEQRTEILAGEAGGRRHRNEVEEAIEAEYGKQETEQNSGDEVECFHWFGFLRSRQSRLSGSELSKLVRTTRPARIRVTVIMVVVDELLS